MKLRHVRLASALTLTLPLTACSGDATTSSSSSTSSGGGGSNATTSSSSSGTGGAGGQGGGPSEKCMGNGPTGNNPYKVAYFGDLHLHTSYSLDAYSFGTRSDPANAYLFAKGQGSVQVGVGVNGTPGPIITQPRPLDFLAVTDHSEWLLVTHGCVLDMNSGYYDANDCGLVRSTGPIDQTLVFASLFSIDKTLCSGNQAACDTQKQNAWQDIIHAADAANEPCHFTSLVAYEWTDQEKVIDISDNKSKSVTNHRNVIFGSDHVPVAPLDSADYPTPPELWTGLDAQCTSASGCEAITLPHNTNLSAGVSLAIWDPSPKGIKQQETYQVSAEVYQHKGSSECYYDPSQGYDDADCQFENVSSVNTGPRGFIRSGLGMGLGYAAAHPQKGNPLKLGIVGATDDHNGAPGNVDEATFVGHTGRNDDQPQKRLKGAAGFGSGAVTGVWAEENTREAVFAAIRRRETFATSGPRILVRFYETNDAAACSDPDFPKKIVDAAAIPMGGTFGTSTLGGKAPSFALTVWPDAVPQKLADDTAAVGGIAKVQVIKVHAHLDQGNPVIVEDPPSPVSGIGATGGCATWQDTTFDPTEYAVYYVRAIQVPTWRWSHHDCATVKQNNPNNWQTLAPGCVPGGGLDVSIEERAWTSPIFFEP